MKKLCFAALIMCGIASVGFAAAYLQSESTSGTKKYCKYNDGTVITIEAYQRCPLSI